MGVTIEDIAREANVSTTTVSRALNNKPDVSEETKKKVLEKVKELGYQPNSMARGLVLQKTDTLGLIIPDISNPFFPEIARGIEDKANEKDYSIIFCNTDNVKEKEKDAIGLMKEKQVDGILLSLSMQNKDELHKLKSVNYPVVQIDREIPGIKYPTVTIDNQLSAYNATKHLLKLGHQKIAHITGDQGTITGAERIKGYKQALNETGVQIKEDWIKKGDFSKESGYKKMLALLKQAETPTAVFAANDMMAIGAYEAIFEQGLSIPQDISLVGHDDIEVASLVKPGLTTMSQPKYQLGYKAVELLIEEIENNSLSSQEIVLETDLVIRKSTGGLIDE